MGIALKTVALVAAVLVIFSARGYSSQSRGFAVQTVSGYQVSNVRYWTDAGGYVESVAFELDTRAREVAARISSTGAWLKCAPDDSVLSWICPLTGAELHMNDADTFQVRAY